MRLILILLIVGAIGAVSYHKGFVDGDKHGQAKVLYKIHHKGQK